MKTITNKACIRFAMTKGDGLWPDFSQLPKSKQNIKYIKSCMKFSPEFTDMNDIIEKWDIIDDGLGDLKFTGGDLIGHPCPIVLFTLNKKVNKEEFLRGVWTSSYKLEVPNLNDEEPWFFEDFNGYSCVVQE